MKFNVGDKVRMRTWEELREIYVLDSEGCMWGSSTASFCITPNMRQYCGKTLEIERVEDDFYQMTDSNYFFEEWMLEPIEPTPVFAIPTQVCFYESLDHVELGERPSYGIAYHDEIVCACCGGVFEVKEVCDIVDLPWVSFRDEIGEE